MARGARVERLTNLLALLLETPRPLTLVEIAAELEGQYGAGGGGGAKDETRRAAFERDKAALREIGVPIESTVLGGDQAGVSAYWIDRHRYELGDLDLDPDEMRALQVAVAAVRPARGREALWKLGLDAADADVAVTAMVPDVGGLPALREASAARADVSFDYRGRRRRLDPYGLLLRSGFWYVVGRDHDHDEQRTYRVDRITGDVEVGIGASFERPADFDLRAAFPADPKQLGADAEADVDQLAVVWVSAARAAAVERELGADHVTSRLDDGAIEVAVPCANRPAFRSWVLGLLEHAEVVGPPNVRTDVVDWLRSSLGAP